MPSEGKFLVEETVLSREIFSVHLMIVESVQKLTSVHLHVLSKSDTITDHL